MVTNSKYSGVKGYNESLAEEQLIGPVHPRDVRGPDWGVVVWRVKPVQQFSPQPDERIGGSCNPSETLGCATRTGHIRRNCSCGIQQDAPPWHETGGNTEEIWEEREPVEKVLSFFSAMMAYIIQRSWCTWSIWRSWRTKVGGEHSLRPGWQHTSTTSSSLSLLYQLYTNVMDLILIMYIVRLMTLSI